MLPLDISALSIVLFSCLTIFLVADHSLYVFIFYYFLSKEFHMYRYLRGEKGRAFFADPKKNRCKWMDTLCSGTHFALLHCQINKWPPLVHNQCCCVCTRGGHFLIRQCNRAKCVPEHRVSIHLHLFNFRSAKQRKKARPFHPLSINT